MFDVGSADFGPIEPSPNRKKYSVSVDVDLHMRHPHVQMNGAFVQSVEHLDGSQSVKVFGHADL